MDAIKTFFSIIALVVFGIIVAAVLFAFGLWFLTAVACVLAAFLFVWALGVPITIKENGVKTGYVRWFTFHSTANKPWQ